MPATNPSVIVPRYVIQHRADRLLWSGDRWVFGLLAARKYHTVHFAKRAAQVLGFAEVVDIREVRFSVPTSAWYFVWDKLTK